MERKIAGMIVERNSATKVTTSSHLSLKLGKLLEAAELT